MPSIYPNIPAIGLSTEALSTLVKPASKLLPIGTLNERDESPPFQVKLIRSRLARPATLSSQFSTSHVGTPKTPGNRRRVYKCLGGYHHLVTAGMSSGTTCHKMR